MFYEFFGWGRHHDREPPRRKPEKPKLYDFEHEQVFEGYDPERDGFAYPLPERVAHQHCTCSVNPKDLTVAIHLCDFCLNRLLMEA